jgi:type IV fimbrial biogenesis protein FimT
MRGMQNTTRGFSVLELMVVLAIAAIVLSVAAPSFGEFRRNSRLTSYGNDFLAAAQVARGEAIKRQVPVVVCPTADPNDANAGCSNGAFNGWIVFQDTNNDCLRNGGEPLLKAGGPIDTTVASSVSNGVCISFMGSGFLAAGPVAGRAIATRTLFCDSRKLAKQAGTNQSAARGIFVTPTGRSRVSRDIDSGVATTDMSTWGLAC